MKRKLRNVKNKVVKKAKKADAYVHDNPYRFVGIAALIGFGIGIALSHCCKKKMCEQKWVS